MKDYILLHNNLFMGIKRKGFIGRIELTIKNKIQDGRRDKMADYIFYTKISRKDLILKKINKEIFWRCVSRVNI